MGTQQLLSPSEECWGRHSKRKPKAKVGSCHLDQNLQSREYLRCLKMPHGSSEEIPQLRYYLEGNSRAKSFEPTYGKQELATTYNYMSNGHIVVGGGP